jgi:hypothetical protein
MLFELLARHRIKPTREIKRVLGGHEAMLAYDYGMGHAPMANPAPAWVYSELNTR